MCLNIYGNKREEERIQGKTLCKQIIKNQDKIQNYIKDVGGGEKKLAMMRQKHKGEEIS